MFKVVLTETENCLWPYIKIDMEHETNADHETYTKSLDSWCNLCFRDVMAIFPGLLSS